MDFKIQFKIPSPYPPCIQAANQLKPIVISQMEPETHHRGKQIAVSVVECAGWPIRIGGTLVTPFKDEEGTLALLQLHNQPNETLVPAKQILRVCGFYLIKEPFLTFATDGAPSLRVDHPSDILLLSEDHELLPVQWRKINPTVGQSVDIRMKGNDAFGKKRWAEAEHLYTTAVRKAGTAEESQLAYLNLSLANLRLGRPATALADAIQSSGAEGSANTEKGLFRQASALYALAKYDQCLDRLQRLRNAFPRNTSAFQMIDRVQSRLHEQQSGQYDFRSMHQQAQATSPVIDCATYTMPVEIRTSPGKGRGVFTTRKVSAGDLLICEKAFGYTCYGELAPSSKIMTPFDLQEDLRAQIVQKLFHNIEDARSFGDLHHGDYDAVPVCEVDGRPVIDSFLVEKVIDLTSFGCPTASLSLLRSSISKDDNGGEDYETAKGIWFLASYINHSCISNARYTFIGDMQIVRATRDLEAGTELLAWYDFPQRFESYNEVQKRLSGWGFTCDCALCLEMKATPAKVHVKRKSLEKELEKVISSGIESMDVSKVQQTFHELNQTYSEDAREPGAVRLELWDLYFTFGKVFNAIGKHSEAIEMALSGLEALGFVISANPRRGVAKSSRPELRIKQWGTALTLIVDAFQILHRAYGTIAPENSKAAKKYMEVAYSMVVGEKDTFLDTFPDLG